MYSSRCLELELFETIDQTGMIFLSFTCGLLDIRVNKPSCQRLRGARGFGDALVMLMTPINYCRSVQLLHDISSCFPWHLHCRKPTLPTQSSPTMYSHLLCRALPLLTLLLRDRGVLMELPLQAV